MVTPRQKLAILAVVLLGVLPAPAFALLESCTVSASPVSFGPYDPASPIAREGVGSISVTCGVTLLGLLVGWDISLSTGSSGSYASRRMTNGPNYLTYNLYTTAGHASIWGNGTGSTVKVSDAQLLLVGSNVNTYTVYGLMPAFQDRPTGTYSDTITVTLNY